MAGVELSYKIDKAHVEEKLKRLKGEDAKKVMKLTVSDMRSKGPSLIARVAAETYELPRTKINPRTKSGKGSVSMTGGSLATIAWVYRGARLAIGGKGFGLTPKTQTMKKSYQSETKILRGKTAILGTWNKPWSEEGAHSAESPWFVVNGLAMKRKGRNLNWTARGPSIPQMVLSVRSQDRLKNGLQNLAVTRLENHIKQILG